MFHGQKYISKGHILKTASLKALKDLFEIVEKRHTDSRNIDRKIDRSINRQKDKNTYRDRLMYSYIIKYYFILCYAIL